MSKPTNFCGFYFLNTLTNQSDTLTKSLVQFIFLDIFLKLLLNNNEFKS